MRRHTRSFLTCTLLASLLLPVLAQANARLDSQRLNYDRALEAIDKEQWEQFRQLEPGLRDYVLYPYIRQALFAITAPCPLPAA